METINDLLRALDNKVPSSIAKRLDGLSKLNEKLAVAREEHNTNPTEDSQEKLDEIIEFITDTQDDLREDLSELVDKKREAELKSRQIAKNKADAEAKNLAERKSREIAKNRADSEARDLAERKSREAKYKEELEQKELLEKEILDKDKAEPKKKSEGMGWGTLIVGGTLLILSAGAINYFGKNR